MAAPYERKWVPQPKISMPTTIISAAVELATPTPPKSIALPPKEQPRRSIALTYERRWVAEPKISMPTTLPTALPTTLPNAQTAQAARKTFLPPLRTSTLPPMASKAYSPLSAASYERQWVPGPKIGMPTTVVVEPTVIPPPKTPPPASPKAPRNFTPALPSNPRPTRPASEAMFDRQQETRPKLNRSTTSAPRRTRRDDDDDDDDFQPREYRPRRPIRAASSATRKTRTRSPSRTQSPSRTRSSARARSPSRTRSEIKSPKLTRRMTDAPPALPPLRIPSPESRKHFDSTSAHAGISKRGAFAKDLDLGQKILEEDEEEEDDEWPVPEKVTSRQRVQHAGESASPQNAGSPQKSSIGVSEEQMSQHGSVEEVESPTIPSIARISARKQNLAEEQISSPESDVFSQGEIVEVADKLKGAAQGFELPKLEFQEPLYLRVVDVTPSQRSSDTIPAGYTKEDGEVVSVNPARISASTMLESLGATDLPSPPSSDDESILKRTSVAESGSDIQTAPLSLRTSPSEPVFVMEKPRFTPPARTPTPPPETSPISSPTFTKSLPNRTSSTKRRSKEQLRRRPSTAGSGSLNNTAPESLTKHLKALENTPRKMFLATSAPFIRAISTPKANTALLSTYLSQERLYLHSTLRLLSLLLANVILPTKPTGLVSPRKGGIRSKQRQDSTLSPQEPETKNTHSDIGERLVDFLISSITKTRKTLDLFEEIEEDIPAIDLDASERIGSGEMNALSMFSKLFSELGGSVEKREKSVLAGLVMIFAREKAHLTAWQTIKSTLSTLPSSHPNSTSTSPSISTSQNRQSQSFDRGALRMYLLPAFTSPSSISHVEELGELIDDLWADKFVVSEEERCFLERRDLKIKKSRENGKGKGMGGGEAGYRDWETEGRLYEGLWEVVLDIQGRFWPVV